jgi:serine protease Do
VAMDIQQQLRTAGRVSRGRSGVVIQEVSKELADSFGLKSVAGALVNGVEKGGPAEKAGVKAGDIILKFDNKPVSASSDLPRIVGGTKPGSTVGMQVFREGQTRDVTVTVAEIPDDRVARAERSRSEAKPAATANRLGLVVSDLSEDKKKDGRVTSGVVVDEVRGAPRADIRVGDVITAVTAKGQTTELKNAAQFNKLLAELDKSTTLTLRIKRGEANVFATIRGETAGG